MKTICLNMIVKNESGVILRCLESVRHLLDYWVIVDTGSDDGTQQIVQETLRDLPGELHERPWVHFEHNRNEALDLGKGKADYLLFIDADEKLEFSAPLQKERLCKNYYLIKNRDRYVDFYRVLLIDNHPGWRWKGVLHEEILPPEDTQGEIVAGALRIGLERDSYRSRDGATYLKDAAILREALEKEPGNKRYLFYLAQSLGAAGDYPAALDAYEQRACLGGFPDEVFLSLYFAACLRHELKQDLPTIVRAYCKAALSEATRREPLYGLCRYFFHRKEYLLAYLLAQEALALPPPKTYMYIQRAIYDYTLPLYFAYCAHALGKKEEAAAAYSGLLENPLLPEHERDLVRANLESVKESFEAC